MSAHARPRTLGWKIVAFVVTDICLLIAWVYFFVLNRTRIIRPYRGTREVNLMFVANHQAPVDSALIALAAFFPRILVDPRLHPWHLAAAEHWFTRPWLSWLADHLRCIPVRRHANDRTALHTICQLVSRGVTVFFPEGRRSMDGTIGPAHAGAGVIALRTGARIVPVAIDGLLAAMPHHRPRPGIGHRFTVAFGDPVRHDEREHTRNRTAAQRIVDGAMHSVQGLRSATGPTVGRRADRFQGRTVWITGASSGIGRALALQLHRRDAHLILSGRRVEALEAVARACTGNAPVHVFPLDLTDRDRLEGLAEEALRVAGHVDYLIHNAAVAARDPVTDTSMDVHRQVMETNYFGVVALTRAVLPSMLQRRSGCFVVISSLTGKFGVPRMGAYAASKHALHGFFESLRAETDDRGIDVTIAIPGFINTPITEHALTGSGARFGRQLLVHLRGMAPDECARRIIRGVGSRRPEFLVGGFEMNAVRLLRVSRGLVAWLVRNHPFRVWNNVRRRLSCWRTSTTREHPVPPGIPPSW